MVSVACQVGRLVAGDGIGWDAGRRRSGYRI